MAGLVSVAYKGVDAAIAELERQQKQVKFALAVALTRSAGIAKDAVRAEMPKDLDRPTNFTLNSMYAVPARKNNLVAYVRIKDDGDRGAPAAKWLTPQIEGVARKNKGSEKRLRSKGYLPSNKYVAPGKGVKLDRYGNITRRTMTAIIQGLESGTKYFLVGNPDNPVGIAQRMSRKNIKMVLAFVSRPNYKKRLDFYGVGYKAADQSVAVEFEKAYAKALATAR